MGKRTKLEKFAENLELPNVFENFSFEHPNLLSKFNVSADFKGSWNKNYFKNNYPIVLELACGRGEYSLALAKTYPSKNFIGIDIKGARIWSGAKKALEEGLHQVAFVRTNIELLPHFFGEQEINEIWITFPDPFLKKSQSNRRLTSKYFLDIYTHLLKPNSILHLKTDDLMLYEFSLENIDTHHQYQILYKKDDIYKDELDYEDLKFKTYYEKQHLSKGRKIKYIRFSLE
ncbi:MAG: tRNA (guanosine(46)-N7)-methyltransferase TrmB [Bacteroidota bacterium]|nr:tRNA (guanosine(46)-N7)-methyltransferase TrmB [Bacteroidota bacterium]